MTDSKLLNRWTKLIVYDVVDVVDVVWIVVEWFVLLIMSLIPWFFVVADG